MAALLAAAPGALSSAGARARGSQNWALAEDKRPGNTSCEEQETTRGRSRQERRLCGDTGGDVKVWQAGSEWHEERGRSVMGGSQGEGAFYLEKETASKWEGQPLE